MISLCKKHALGFSPLSDLGYEVQLIEQEIRTAKDKVIKPDVIKVSKKSQHAIVFECKSGTNDSEQTIRYQTLAEEDLRRWLTLTHQTQPVKFDICITNLEENHNRQKNPTSFAVLTFGSKTLSKTNRFSAKDVEDKFAKPVSIDRAKLPLSYYPFSDSDQDAVIMERILRQLAIGVMKAGRGGPAQLDGTEFSSDDVLLGVHPYWHAFSREHQGRLRERIQRIVQTLRTSNPQLQQMLLEARPGSYRVRGPPQSFNKLCEEIISESRIQRTLDSS